MYCEKITYTDYDGNEHTDKFYFNLNESELIEMSYSKKGGYESWLRRIISERDNTKIVPIVKNIILASYGKKSDDGSKFLKSPQITEDFLRSDAYNKLFIKLFSNGDALVNFCNGIIPKSLAEKAVPEQEKIRKELVEEHTPDKDNAD